MPDDFNQEAHALVEKYNAMLRNRFGSHITVILRYYIDDDDSVKYYYTSAKYGESNAFDTAEAAYADANDYLNGVGEIY